MIVSFNPLSAIRVNISWEISLFPVLDPYDDSSATQAPGSDLISTDKSKIANFIKYSWHLKG